MAKHKYEVIADFIHPHKDCMGECIVNLEYDEALIISNEWKKDKIHKNVDIIEFQR